MSTNRQVIGYENVALFQSNTGAYATGSNSETGMVFIGNAQSLDFSFSVNREDVEGLGSRGLVSTQNTTAVDVDLTINTLEDFSGLFNRSFLSGQSRSGDTNIYAVIGLDKSKDIVRQNLSGQDILCFGNCFLRNLSMSQSVGGIMSSNYEFAASNVEVNKIEPRVIYTNDFENVTGLNGEDLTVTEADFDVSTQQIGDSSPKNISSIGGGTRGNMAELFPLNFNQTLKIRDFFGGDVFITGTDYDAYQGLGIPPHAQNPALDGHIHGNKSLMFGEEKNGYGYAVAITDFPKTGRYIIEGGVRVFPDNQIALELHPFNVLTGYQASLFTDQGGLNTSTKRNTASQVSTGLLIERHTSETFDGDHGRFKRFHNEFEIENTITGGLILVAKDLNQDLGVDVRPASRDHFVYLSDLTIKYMDEFQVRAPAIDLSGSQEQNTTGYFSGIGNYTGHLNYYKGNQTSVSIKRKANKNVLFEDDFSNGNIENVPILKNTVSGVNFKKNFGTSTVHNPDIDGDTITRTVSDGVLSLTIVPDDGGDDQPFNTSASKAVCVRFGEDASVANENMIQSGVNYLLTGECRVSDPGSMGNTIARVDFSDLEFEFETRSTDFVPFNIEITGFPKHPKTKHIFRFFDLSMATVDINNPNTDQFSSWYQGYQDSQGTFDVFKAGIIGEDIFNSRGNEQGRGGFLEAHTANPNTRQDDAGVATIGARAAIGLKHPIPDSLTADIEVNITGTLHSITGTCELTPFQGSINVDTAYSGANADGAWSIASHTKNGQAIAGNPSFSSSDVGEFTMSFNFTDSNQGTTPPQDNYLRGLRLNIEATEGICFTDFDIEIKRPNTAAMRVNAGRCEAQFRNIKLFEVDNFGEDTFLIKPDNIQSLSLGLPVNRRTVYSLGKQYPVLRKSLGTNIGSLDLSVLNADFSHDENKDFYENGKEDLSTNLNEFLSRNNDYDITISGSGTALAGETYVNRVSNGFIRNVHHIPSHFGTFTAGDRFDGLHVNINFTNLSKTVISTDEEAIEASSYLGSDVANFTKDIPKKNGNKNEAIRFKPTSDNITPQLSLFNNHGDSTVSSTYLDRKHGIVEIIYFVPSASPLVGNYIHIGAANSKDPGEGGIVDKKDIYSRKGAKIVGGAWTKARVSFGSRYGGRDKPGDGTSAGGNNRFITFFTTELIDDTTDFVQVDINDSWYLAEYVLLDTFDPTQEFSFELPSSKLNSETFNSAIGRLSTSNINFSFDRNLITYNN